MAKKKSSVTYYDPHNVWALIQDDFAAHLPLRNLHWKSASRPLRSIQSLDVEMHHYDPSADEQPHQMPISLLERPYLNMMLVKCDDNEIYRNSVRHTIRTWYNGVVAKRNQEWLILHVIPKTSNAAGKPGSRFSMKGSVYDKIRADFNNSKKDRCAQLRSCDTEAEELEMWQDIFSKIKECVLQSFDSRVLHYEEDIRKMDSQRNLPGWNYCTFFILKEGLAQSFEHMLLLEDALIQYDELEASFFQLLRDKQLTWFTRTGGTAPGDDSANILDLSHKDYRNLILANNISIFDFRIYLFARQAFLLTSLGRYAEICTRARDYISTMARTLHMDRDDRGISYIESWMYSAAMQVVEAASKAPKTVPLSAAIGDLYVVARSQLDKIGHHFELIPKSVPFEGVFSDVSLESDETSSTGDFKTTNPVLQQVIKDPTKFAQLYENITLHALHEFEAGHREGSAQCMTADLAALYFHQKHYAKVTTLLKQSSVTSSKKGWNSVDCAIMKLYAQCLDLTDDIPGHLNILLKLLLHRTEIGQIEGKKCVDELESDLLKSNISLERPLQNYFAIQIGARACHRNNEDGFSIKLFLTNLLPRSITLSSIKVQVTSVQTGRDLAFKADNVTLNPGKNVVWTTCNITATGIYIFERVLLKWHSLVFKQDFVETGRKQHLNLYPHGDAMAIDADLARDVYLDRPKRLVVSVNTGWNALVNGQLCLSTIQNNVKFLTEETVCQLASTDFDDGEHLTLLNIESLEFGKVPRNSILRFSMPFTISGDLQSFDLKVELKYSTTAGEYLYFRTFPMSAGLALSVGVTDAFRLQTLVSIFSVQVAGGPLRILNVRLDSDKVFKVWTASPQQRNLICNAQTSAKFIYQITKEGSLEDVANCVRQGHPLTFVIQYRRLDNEILHILKKGLDSMIQERKMQRLASRLHEALRETANIVDFQVFGDFGTIVTKEWDEKFSDLSQSDQAEIKDLVKQFHQTFNERKIDDAELNDLPQETLYIPADIPSIDVVNKLALSLNRTGGKVVLGEPVEAKLSIRSSFNWNLIGNPLSEVECYYDIVPEPDVWLISGCKRAHFQVKDGGVQTFRMVFVPLKCGVIRIPKVDIEMLTPNVLCEIDDASKPDIVVLPRKFTAVYRVEVPESQPPPQQQQAQDNNDQ